MVKRVTIFGGSGFVGRNVAAQAVERGWEVRVASRRAQAIDGVESVVCDILSDADVTAAVEGAQAVVNCVGILAPSGANTFEGLQAQAPGRIANASSAAGVQRMVHVSSIGADATSPSLYQRTKAAGEAAVVAEMPGALVLRPSIIFGPGDSFFNRFADMSKLSPFVPLVGAKTRFQPVFVGDVAAAVVAGLEGDQSGIYELGGPETEGFAELMERMLKVLGRSRLVLPLPTPIGSLMGFGFETLSAISGGRIEPQITRDQVRNLGADNVVSGEFPGLAELGLTPTAMGDALPSYLS
ncbi:MAG: complex I NDUFA9 subunit family protein [Pseudomonadota bacterium]